MMSYICYRIATYSLKKYINSSDNDKYFKDTYRPGNLPIGVILKYTSGVFCILV